MLTVCTQQLHRYCGPPIAVLLVAAFWTRHGHRAPLPLAGHQAADDAGKSAAPAVGGPPADPHRGGCLLERGQVCQHAARGDAVESAEAAPAAWRRQG